VSLVRCILIDPKAQTVTEAECDTNRLEAIVALIDCAYFEDTRLPNGDHLLLDFPDLEQVGNEREHSQRSWQRQARRDGAGIHPGCTHDPFGPLPWIGVQGFRGIVCDLKPTGRVFSLMDLPTVLRWVSSQSCHEPESRPGGNRPP